MKVQYITGKPLLYFRGVQLNLKTHLQCHLVPCTHTDTTSLTELGENTYVHHTSMKLADRFALCSFNISLGTLGWIRDLYADYFLFRLPQRPHNLFADSALERLYPPSCFDLQAIPDLSRRQGDSRHSSAVEQAGRATLWWRWQEGRCSGELGRA